VPNQKQNCFQLSFACFPKLQKTKKYSTFVKVGLYEEILFLDLLFGRKKNFSSTVLTGYQKQSSNLE